MQTAQFDYYRPESIAEAIDLLTSIEGSRPLAGGHSLLPAMKMRVASPPALVDLGRIGGLSAISRNGTSVTVGALATHAAVAASDTLVADCRILAEAAAQIGDPQVRNRGTIGGSVAHADPAADYPTVLTALDATITVAGSGGERSITAGEFFVDLFATALGPGELVTAVQVPALGAGRGAAYVKHRHPASGYAVVGVAAVVGVTDGSCSSASICIGGATATPQRVETAAQALLGQTPGEDSAAAAAAAVSAGLANPIGDVYASAEYRVHLAGVLTKRAIGAAFARAG
jgi:carbon-monoxide dehydrogenase medium subunit